MDKSSPSFTLRVPGRLPSWNQICGMEHWGRAKLKKDIQAAFLSALRASACDSSTKITSAKNTMSIAADTLASYQATTLAKQKSRRVSKRLSGKIKSTF